MGDNLELSATLSITEESFNLRGGPVSELINAYSKCILFVLILSLNKFHRLFEEVSSKLILFLCSIRLSMQCYVLYKLSFILTHLTVQGRGPTDIFC